MKVQNQIKLLLSGCFAIVCLALSACASNFMLAEGPCAVPSTKNLDKAIEHSRNALSDHYCSSDFENHFDNLLRVAEENPSADNNRRFSNFLQWAETTGLIGNTKAKHRYTRYFSRTFVALPDNYSNCSSTCPRVPKVQSDLRAELVEKERGSRILSNKQLMLDAHQDFEKVQLLLEATCISCQANAS